MPTEIRAEQVAWRKNRREYGADGNAQAVDDDKVGHVGVAHAHRRASLRIDT